MKSVFTAVSALAACAGLVFMAAPLSFANVSAEQTNTQYNASCATCHQVGVLGAPRAGDAAAWKARLAKGMPTLVEHTKNGYKNMPARGLCDNCSDEDYAALIKKMASK